MLEFIGWRDASTLDPLRNQLVVTRLARSRRKEPSGFIPNCLWCCRRTLSPYVISFMLCKSSTLERASESLAGGQVGTHACPLNRRWQD